MSVYGLHEGQPGLIVRTAGIIWHEDADEPARARAASVE